MVVQNVVCKSVLDREVIVLPLIFRNVGGSTRMHSRWISNVMLYCWMMGVIFQVDMVPPYHTAWLSQVVFPCWAAHWW